MPGERQLLDAAADDDIDVCFALMYLGVRTFEGEGTPRATAEEIEAGFIALARLRELGLIEVGRFDYVDDRYIYVSEPIDLVKQRVLDAAANESDPTGWYSSAWIVATNSPSAAT